MNLWLGLTASVRGAAHARGNLPNQDAAAVWPTTGAGPPLVLALADGHGSPVSFRSDTGARLAVETAISQLRSLAEKLECSGTELDGAAEAAAGLPKAVVEAWQAAARTHLDGHPFDETERARLDQHPDWHDLLAYGSTLLGLLASTHVLVLLQLGDGDILCVDRDGTPRRPWARDPRLIGNETTSLCVPNSWDEMRMLVRPLDGDGPALVLLTTDGYANSFATADDFLQIGPDFLGLLRQHGRARLSHELESFLAETSNAGSGDDTSVGLAWLEGRQG